MKIDSPIPLKPSGIFSHRPYPICWNLRGILCFDCLTGGRNESLEIEAIDPLCNRELVKTGAVGSPNELLLVGLKDEEPASESVGRAESSDSDGRSLLNIIFSGVRGRFDSLNNGLNAPGSSLIVNFPKLCSVFFASDSKWANSEFAKEILVLTASSSQGQ